MRIGHSGRTRVEELILASVLFFFAARTALPTANTIYVFYFVKIVFAVLIASPAVWLLLAHTLVHRKHALLAVLITYFYCGVLTVVVLGWTWFAFVAAVFGLMAFSGYLYYLTREEITWIQQQSSPSSQPGPEPLDTSSSG